MNTESLRSAITALAGVTPDAFDGTMTKDVIVRTLWVALVKLDYNYFYDAILTGVSRDILKPTCLEEDTVIWLPEILAFIEHDNTVKILASTDCPNVTKFTKQLRISKAKRDCIIDIYNSSYKHIAKFETKHFWSLMDASGIDLSAHLDAFSVDDICYMLKSIDIFKYLDFTKLDSFNTYDWLKLMKAKPELYEKYSYKVHASIILPAALLDNPGLASYRIFNSLPSDVVVQMLIKNSLFKSLCDWSRLTVSDWITLLNNVPSYRDVIVFSTLEITEGMSSKSIVKYLETIK